MAGASRARGKQQMGERSVKFEAETVEKKKPLLTLEEPSAAAQSFGGEEAKAIGAASLKNARLITELLKDCEDAATKAFNRFARKCDRASMGERGSMGGEAKKSSSDDPINEVRKQAMKLRLKRRDDIVSRLRTMPWRHSAKPVVNIAEAIEESQPPSLSPSSSSSTGSIQSESNEYWQSQTQTRTSRLSVLVAKDGMALKPPTPRKSSGGLQLQSLRRTASFGLEETREEWQRFVNLDDAEGGKANADRPRVIRMQTREAHNPRRRIAEIARLRNRFRDQRVVMGGRLTKRAQTEKCARERVAANLGLTPEEWIGCSPYKTSIEELELLSERKTRTRREKAARTLQVAWRNRLARRSALAKIALKTIASIRIQKHWRTSMFIYRLPIRMLVLVKETYTHAAVLIQARYRGRLARKRMANRMAIQKVSSKMKRLCQELDESLAPEVVLIQVAIRGFLASRWIERLEAEQALREVPMREDSEVVIQGSVSDRKEDHSDADSSTPSHRSESLGDKVAVHTTTRRRRARDEATRVAEDASSQMRSLDRITRVWNVRGRHKSEDGEEDADWLRVRGLRSRTSGYKAFSSVPSGGSRGTPQPPAGAPMRPGGIAHHYSTPVSKAPSPTSLPQRDRLMLPPLSQPSPRVQGM